MFSRSYQIKSLRKAIKILKGPDARYSLEYIALRRQGSESLEQAIEECEDTLVELLSE